jgi:hypothetical protein
VSRLRATARDPEIEIGRRHGETTRLAIRTRPADRRLGECEIQPAAGISVIQGGRGT